LAGRCEARVLGQESVAGVNRIRVRFARGIENGGNREVALSRRSWAEANRVVGKKYVRRMRVRVRIDGHRWNPQLTAGANDTDGNLAAIGDEDSTYRLTFQLARRFSRNARSPSCPSFETRCAAIASAVSPAASDAPRAQTRGMSALAVAIASGAP